MHRGEVDDATPAALVHAWQRGAGQQERRLEHDPEEQREALGRELLHGRDVLEPGVVDQDVGVDPQRVQLRAGQVHDQRAAVQLIGDRLGPVGVPVEHRDLGAGGGQPPCAGPADAAGRPGDQGPAASQVEVAGPRCRAGRRIHGPSSSPSCRSCAIFPPAAGKLPSGRAGSRPGSALTGQGGRRPGPPRSAWSRCRFARPPGTPSRRPPSAPGRRRPGRPARRRRRAGCGPGT